MWAITASTGSNRPKVSEGSHEVMLVKVVDLGTQEGTGMYPEPKRKIEIMYEVMDQQAEFNWETKPMALWEFAVPYVSTKKVTNYHKKLNALTGKSLTFEEAQVIDFDDMLWTIYTAQVTYNGDFANIDTLTKVSEKTKKAYADYIPMNDMFVFSLENFDETKFNKLNEKKQAKIKLSPEYKKIIEGDDVTDPKEEQLPF